MTIGGWAIMLVSVGFVTGLLGWSVGRVLSIGESTRRLHSQADIEPEDVQIRP